MVRPSSEPGVVLDVDWEKMTEVNLPLVKVNRTVTYKGKKIETRQDEMGEVMLMGDMHIGHGSHSGNPLRAHLKFLQDRPHIMIGLMGDYIEYAANTGFVKEETIDIDGQINAFVRLMKPLKDRIIFALWGNHEERFAKYTKSNRLLISIMAEIGVPEHCYTGDPQRGVFCAIKAGTQTYGSYFQHGLTGAIANEFYQQKKTSQNNRVALVGQGHTHKLGSSQITEKSMERIGEETAMITRRRWLVNTGCFIKEAGYAEAKSYPYSVVGAPLVRFYSNKEKIDVTDLTLDYKDYMVKGGIIFGDPIGITDFNGFWKNAERKRRFAGERIKKRDLSGRRF